MIPSVIQNSLLKAVGQVQPVSAGLQSTVTLGPAVLAAGGVGMLMLQVDTLYQSANGIAAVMRDDAGLLLSFTPAKGKRYRIGGDLKVPKVTYIFTAGGMTIQGVWMLHTDEYLVTPVLGQQHGSLTLLWHGQALLRTITLGPL